MLRQINNVKVGAIPIIGGGDSRPIKGEELFSEVYANIFICAKKNSGKTSTIYKIIKSCSVKGVTKVYAFVSTIHKDNNWIAIKELCKNKGFEFHGYTSLKDGEDVLESLITSLQEEPVEEIDKDEPKQKNVLLVSDDDDEVETKRPRSKYRASEYIFVFDDLSTELKSKSLVALTKKNRHYKSKCIISSQYLNDILPEMRLQMDYWLVFAGQNDAKLEEIYRNADLSITFEQFKRIYAIATDERYSFLYISRDGEFRKNFSHKIEL